MTFNNLGNIFEFFNYFPEMTRMVEKYTNISTCFKAYHHGINLKFRSSYNANTYQPLNPLMNCGARYSTISRNFKVRNPCILRDNVENPVSYTHLRAHETV